MDAIKLNRAPDDERTEYTGEASGIRFRLSHLRDCWSLSAYRISDEECLTYQSGSMLKFYSTKAACIGEIQNILASAEG